MPLIIDEHTYVQAIWNVGFPSGESLYVLYRDKGGIHLWRRDRIYDPTDPGALPGRNKDFKRFSILAPPQEWGDDIERVEMVVNGLIIETCSKVPKTAVEYTRVAGNGEKFRKILETKEWAHFSERPVGWTPPAIGN
jgi:hypothetical protein